VAANSGQLVQALVGGGVSPAAARVIANALANSHTPEFSSSRDLSDQTPTDLLRLVTPDTRRYQLANLDYSRERPYQSALESSPGRYVPETTDHPYKDSQPVLPAPPLSAPRILGGSYTEISDAIVDGAQQTRVSLRISKNTGVHLRANAATNSLEVVPFEISAPQGLVTAEVAEESDKTTIQLQVRGITTQSVRLGDGSSVDAYLWTAGAITPPAPGSSGVPTGVVVACAAEIAGTEWLLCDGRAISRTTFANLFAVLSDYYGAGDGSTTFNIPDYRGYFLRGAGANSDGTAAGTFGTRQGFSTARPTTALTGDTNNTGAHTHTVPASDNPAGAGPYFGELGSNLTANIGTSSAGNHSHTVSITGGGDAETRPKNIPVNYYIKT